VITDNATTTSLLREIADAARQNPEEGFMEFEWAEGRKPFKINDDGWAELCRRAADPGYTVRRRPRTIAIGGVKVPEPMREPPPVETEYWIADPFRSKAHREYWDGFGFEYEWLRRGFCHLTKEAAETHARALIIASGGEVE